MTLIRMHDIREADVHPDAGMSNIPWEYEYGFQRETDLSDDQSDVLEELYSYSPSTDDERVLDGLSPNAKGLFHRQLVKVGRDGEEREALASQEFLIQDANRRLREAAQDLAVAVQREYLHPGPDITVVYEMCPANKTTKCLVIDGIAHPLSQLLDLRGFSVIGKMEWVDAD